MELIERKIGETFEYEGKTIKVKEGENCSCHDCFFAKRCTLPVIKMAGECAANCREDNKSVVFVEVHEQPQEQTEPQKLNLCEILKYCPEGEPFWSPMLGDVKLHDIIQSEDIIIIEAKNRETWEINSDGTMNIGDIISPEIMLYPSKEQRDWTKVKYKNKKERFNPKTLQTFDKVLSRNSKNITWSIDYFSHMEDIYKPYQFFCLSDNYTYCIPYNDDTKHLVGTKKEVPEYYRYWED